MAVLFVVLSHLGNDGLFLFPHAPHDAIGKVGVWIFFSLSAYLLTGRLLRGFRAGGPVFAVVASYAIHRLFRIFPLYLVVLTAHRLLSDFSTPIYLRHMLLLEGAGELWAIPVEFTYYIAMPIIAAACAQLGPRKTTVGLLALLATSFGYTLFANAEVFSHSLSLVPKAAPFLMGSALAMLLPEDKLLQQRCNMTTVGIISALALFAATAVYRGIYRGPFSNSVAPYLSLLLAIIACGLIGSAVRSSAMSRLFSATVLACLGRISFSLYLWHMFVVRLALQVPEYSASRTLLAWLTLLTCIGCSFISYAMIERLGIRAGLAISKRLAERRHEV